MLAYAVGRQKIAATKSSPSTMLLIVGGHVAAVALAMSAKFIIDARPTDPGTDVIFVEPDPVPPPPDPQPRSDPSRPTEHVFVPDPTVPRPPIPAPDMGTTADPVPPTGTVIGSEPPAPPILLPMPPRPADPVRIAVRFATPAHLVRPPYPSSKLDSQEEASLRLKLTIDERGRVTAVDPVGANDAAFVAAARRHLIAKWRYQPATVDGKPIPSSTVITLRFELEG